MSDRIAGITSNTVPWEILRAAGYTPVLLEDEPGPTPHADRWMEDVFDRRIRVIFDRVCAGAWDRLDKIVIPRTSEQEHKLYLYLREISRKQEGPALPDLYLYNLLHTRTPESHNYGLERTRQMIRHFEVPEGALHDAIAESNRARRCVRAILQKRRDGFLKGSVALGLIRGFYIEDRTCFAERVCQDLEGLRPIPASGPRIVIQGAPLEGATLHRAVEESGGYVVAEDDWRGSRAAGDHDVRMDLEPAIAIFEKYFYDEISPRIQPSSERDAWFHRELERGGIDGVLFYIPLQDDFAGWDYPRQSRWLEKLGVAHAVVRDGRNSSALDAFVRSLRR
ncbi:MAG TPA: 2-hydroxyacyl-CoA dehydratase family protein [Bryobacteraceae bacterium]|jgi:hypothetical protein